MGLLTSFTGVTNNTNEGSVPFWSNRVRVLILSMLDHWKHFATLVGLKVWSRDPHGSLGVPNDPLKDSVQMETTGPLRVELWESLK